LVAQKQQITVRVSAAATDNQRPINANRIDTFTGSLPAYRLKGALGDDPSLSERCFFGVGSDAEMHCIERRSLHIIGTSRAEKSLACHSKACQFNVFG
jgi:hypothetical protein